MYVYMAIYTFIGIGINNHPKRMFFIIYAQQKEKEKNKSKTTLIKQQKNFRENSVLKV